MCIIGLATQDAPINPTSWLMKEVAVTSSMAYFYEDFEIAMGMIADGRVEVASLHTVTTGMDGLADVIDELAAGPTDQTKVLVRPDWSY